jgi:hypothetical protein
MNYLDADHGDAKDIESWTEILLCDKDLLPAGRALERYAADLNGKPREMRIVMRSPGVFEGYVDMANICLGTSAQDTANFLVDWVHASK